MFGKVPVTFFGGILKFCELNSPFRTYAVLTKSCFRFSSDSVSVERLIVELQMENRIKWFCTKISHSRKKGFQARKRGKKYLTDQNRDTETLSKCFVL